MDELDSGFVADLIGRIYEAAVDQAHWGEFVAALERVYPESRVTMFGHDNGCPTANLGACVNYAPDDLNAYTTYYASCSPYIARGALLPTGKAFRYEMAMDQDELKQTEYYNDYLRPRRLGHYGTGFIIDRDGPQGTPPKRATVLSIADHKNDAERRARQLRLLDLLGPHLQRAMRLHRTMTVERASAGAAQSAIDHWSHAVVVFDASACIVTFNLAAETLLKRADGLWIGRGGQLCSVDDTKTRALELAIRRCAMADSGDQQSGDLDGLQLPRPSGLAPLRLMLCRLPGSRTTLMSEGAGAVLLLIIDPSQARRTPIGWLAKQFGLSPAEQRLAEAVVNGSPLAEAAEQLGIQLSTARTRLKTIQTKTNCHRQVDLVRLALSLPAVREP